MGIAYATKLLKTRQGPKSPVILALKPVLYKGLDHKSIMSYIQGNTFEFAKAEKRRSVLLVLEIEKEFETTRVSPMLAFPHTGDTRNNILWRPY